MLSSMCRDLFIDYVNPTILFLCSAQLSWSTQKKGRVKTKECGMCGKKSVYFRNDVFKH